MNRESIAGDRNEWHQAVIRVLIVATVTLYLWIANLFDFHSATAEAAVALTGTYLFVSILSIASFRIWPGTSHVRRSVTLIMDLSATSFAALLGGELLAPFFAVYMWIILGFGIRYGVRYLVVATGFSGSGIRFCNPEQCLLEVE